MPNTTFKLILAFAVLLFGLVPAEARRGYVRTREGRVLEGHLRFESNAVIIVNAAQELWARVALTNLDALGFATETETGPVPARGNPSANGTPGELPWPWQHEDIGSAVRPGEADALGGMIRVRSSGTNVLGDGDSCHFVYKTVSGETEIISRVARVQCVDSWAAAGLMLREGLAADARQVFLALTPARGGHLTSREQTRGETSVALFPTASAPGWLRLRRDRDAVTAWHSRDGQRWVIAGRLEGTWPEELLVGLAATGGRQGIPSQTIFEQVEEAPSVRNRFFTPQVELISGSIQIGYIASLDETALEFAGFNRPAVSTPRVAMIRFQTVPSKLAPRLASGRPGVLLTSGEFIEGDCRRIERARVVVNSVPLGVRRYDVNHEVLAVVLGRRAFLAPRVYEVHTADGGIWLANEVSLDATGLLVREPQLGTRRLAWHEVVELRRAT